MRLACREQKYHDNKHLAKPQKILQVESSTATRFACVIMVATTGQLYFRHAIHDCRLLVSIRALNIKHDLRCGTLGEAVNSDQTEEEGSEPEDHGEERESLCSFPLTTLVAAAERETRPVPSRSTVRTVEPSHKKTEDGGPTSSED
jgi:hypothetical protein